MFRDGQWLALVDQDNRRVGTGIYESEGAIGVRILERSSRPVDAAWVGERTAAALERRRPLLGETDAFRAIHGESDGLPAVVVDVYGGVGVLQTYSAGSDALGRLVAGHVQRRLDLRAVVWKPAVRRRGQARPLRALIGTLPAGPLTIREGDLELPVDVAGGQKSGAYLDLRGLRRWVRTQDLTGRRVLNLFSYTGWLGLAAARAGAAEVLNVDASREAALLGGRSGQRFIAADAFEWVASAPGPFDLVIVDPPPMTSRTSQVERALSTYRRLYRAVSAHVAPGGRVAACCCTSRIGERAFVRAVAAGLGPDFRTERRLPAELDHPVGFPEADYLKVVLFARTAGGRSGVLYRETP